MLRAMILIVLALLLLVAILTQVILPMFIDELSFFWYFRKGSRDDITIGINDSSIPKDDQPQTTLEEKAHEAKKNFVDVKKEIKSKKQKLDKLDKDTEV